MLVVPGGRDCAATGQFYKGLITWITSMLYPISKCLAASFSRSFSLVAFFLALALCSSFALAEGEGDPVPEGEGASEGDPEPPSYEAGKLVYFGPVGTDDPGYGVAATPMGDVSSYSGLGTGQWRTGQLGVKAGESLRCERVYFSDDDFALVYVGASAFVGPEDIHMGGIKAALTECGVTLQPERFPLRLLTTSGYYLGSWSYTQYQYADSHVYPGYQCWDGVDYLSCVASFPDLETFLNASRLYTPPSPDYSEVAVLPDEIFNIPVKVYGDFSGTPVNLPPLPIIGASPSIGCVAGEMCLIGALEPITVVYADLHLQTAWSGTPDRCPSWEDESNLEFVYARSEMKGFATWGRWIRYPTDTWYEVLVSADPPTMSRITPPEGLPVSPSHGIRHSSSGTNSLPDPYAPPFGGEWPLGCCPAPTGFGYGSGSCATSNCTYGCGVGRPESLSPDGVFTLLENGYHALWFFGRSSVSNNLGFSSLVNSTFVIDYAEGATLHGYNTSVPCTGIGGTFARPGAAVPDVGGVEEQVLSMANMINNSKGQSGKEHVIDTQHIGETLLGSGLTGEAAGRDDLGLGALFAAVMSLDGVAFDGTVTVGSVYNGSLVEGMDSVFEELFLPFAVVPSLAFRPSDIASKGAGLYALGGFGEYVPGLTSYGVLLLWLYSLIPRFWSFVFAMFTNVPVYKDTDAEAPEDNADSSGGNSDKGTHFDRSKSFASAGRGGSADDE